VQIINEMVVGR